MGIDFDTHEITALVKTFEKATGGPAVADVEKVLFKGSMNIKTDAARRISGHPRFRRLPGAVDFDMYRNLKGPASEIGYNHDKPQGNLGHVAEYGGLRSAPLPALGPAGDAEEPKFAKAIEDLAVKAFGP